MKRSRYVTEPYAEPIHLDEAKAHLRVDGNGEDDLIRAAITTARRHVERETRRQIVTATLRLSLDGFNGCDADDERYERSWARLYGGGFRPVLLDVQPLVSVDSITYVDTGGTTRTLTEGTDFVVDDQSEPARIVPAYGKPWPAVRPFINTVQITYKAGYLTPVTFDADADTFMISGGRTFAGGTAVRLYNSGGVLPAGLAANTDYYVIGTTRKLSATSSPLEPVDITDDGTGTTFIQDAAVGMVPQQALQAIRLLLGTYYENREATISGTIIAEVPLGVQMLLDQLKWTWQ